MLIGSFELGWIDIYQFSKLETIPTPTNPTVKYNTILRRNLTNEKFYKTNARDCFKFQHIKTLLSFENYRNKTNVEHVIRLPPPMSTHKLPLLTFMRIEKDITPHLSWLASQVNSR
jgi:hypothetical protein